MKPNCKNHPDRLARVDDLCGACYMRKRRAEYAAEHPTERRGKAPAGTSVARLLTFWTDDAAAKFKARVDTSAGPDGCHTWRGGKIKTGHGVFTYAGQAVPAHRLAYALATGHAMPEVVVQTCGNTRCINPAHLRAGTSFDRRQAKAARHRHPSDKPVQTPHGDFPTAEAAAREIGVTLRLVQLYCAQGSSYTSPMGYLRMKDVRAGVTKGWKYL